MSKPSKQNKQTNRKTKMFSKEARLRRAKLLSRLHTEEAGEAAGS